MLYVVLESQLLLRVFMLAQQMMLLTEPSPEWQTTLESFTTTNNAKLETKSLTWTFGAIQDADYSVKIAMAW